ncbi:MULTISPECIES: hypothetical protein [unclassified Streptomyces]|uniref:hypothetical protein n=1 Tax=unclassified Streptomyces TaxID=2593676 RepID=UPI0037F93675
MADLTGRKFEIRGKSPWPVPKGEAPRVRGFAKGFGIAGGALTVAQAPALIEEHGWGGGLWEMFEGMIDPFRVSDSSMSSPCDDNPNACIA